jgi:hypothetical protein
VNVESEVIFDDEKSPNLADTMLLHDSIKMVQEMLLEDQES